MELIPLPKAAVAEHGFTHKAIITYADLTAAAGASDTTVTLTLFPNPDSASDTFAVGTVVDNVAFDLVTAFDASDAAINSLLLEVGDGGATARLSVQKELAVDGTEILCWQSALAYAYPVADTLDAKFTVAGGASPTIDELTSGEVHIYFRVKRLEPMRDID